MVTMETIKSVFGRRGTSRAMNIATTNLRLTNTLVAIANWYEENGDGTIFDEDIEYNWHIPTIQDLDYQRDDILAKGNKTIEDLHDETMYDFVSLNYLIGQLEFNYNAYCYTTRGKGWWSNYLTNRIKESVDYLLKYYKEHY